MMYSYVSYCSEGDKMINKIKYILSEELDIEVSEIKEDSRIQEDLGADSLAIMEIFLALEEAFDIEIPYSIVENMKTVNDIVDYLKKHSIGYDIWNFPKRKVTILDVYNYQQVGIKIWMLLWMDLNEVN